MKKVYPVGNQRLSFRGFTIIELLVVIAIIGLLSMLIVINLKNAKERAEQKKAMAFAHTVRVSLGSDLVGEWRFDDTSNLGKDTSGYDNHGTNHGASSVDGIIRNAGEFKSSESDYLDCGSDDSLNITDAITVEAWVKIRSGHTTADDGIIGKGEGLVGYLLYANQNKISFYVNEIYSITPSAISTGEWHHLVGTYDGSSTIYLYVDGDEADDDSQNTLTSLSANLYLGTYSTSNNIPRTQSIFDGTIDEVRIYNRALSTTEIQRHYAEGAAKHGIVLK